MLHCRFFLRPFQGTLGTKTPIQSQAAVGQQVAGRVELHHRAPRWKGQRKGNAPGLQIQNFSAGPPQANADVGRCLSKVEHAQLRWANLRRVQKVAPKVSKEPHGPGLELLS